MLFALQELKLVEFAFIRKLNLFALSFINNCTLKSATQQAIHRSYQSWVHKNLCLQNQRVRCRDAGAIILYSGLQTHQPVSFRKRLHLYHRSGITARFAIGVIILFQRRMLNKINFTHAAFHHFLNVQKSNAVAKESIHGNLVGSV